MTTIRSLLHGSYRKHFEEIVSAREIFVHAGIDVLDPTQSSITSMKNGFAFFEGQEDMDPREVELYFLANYSRLGRTGFCYFVNPGGYIGKSASYELGLAQAANIPCFFMAKPDDHPVYIPNNSIWSPENLASYIMDRQKLPDLKVKRNEKKMHQLWTDMIVPGSVVATGAILEFSPKRGEKQILLVRTHKWQNRFTMVGGKVRRNELLVDALAREVREETGLKGHVGRHICTFDQLSDSGYYMPGISHIFVDNVFHVDSRRIRLNDENQDYVWMPPNRALNELDIEPNARKTVEIYLGLTSTDV